MEKRRGRPTRLDARRKKLGFKASEAEKLRLMEVARLNGKNLTEFIREAVESAAAESSEIQIFRQSV